MLVVSAIGELAALPRHLLLARLTDATERADRAEMRLACWRLAEAFGAMSLLGAECTCGHLGNIHWGASSACGDSHDHGVGPFYDCPCRAFVAQAHS